MGVGHLGESEIGVGTEVLGLLIDPDADGALVRVANDHQSICRTLNASNTEAYFLRQSPAIAWMSAHGGEWNLSAGGFLHAMDGPASVGTISGPVLIVGRDDDGEVADVPSGLILAARRYGILSAS